MELSINNGVTTRYPSAQNRLLNAALICCISLASLASARTYATRFPSMENPISEGGAWICGAKDGLDWGDVSTTAGQTHPHPGPARYADATALLSGAWGPDQSAQGVVWTGNPSNYPEVEIRLRSSLSAHHCDGYEITFSIAPNAYLLIVRWNGPLGDYTVLNNPQGAQYQVKAGDTVQAAIVGKVISAYKNGVLMGQATDSVYASGLPGMGFNEQQNGDYGYASFSATDGVATAILPQARAGRFSWVTSGLPWFGLKAFDKVFDKAFDLTGRKATALQAPITARGPLEMEAGKNANGDAVHMPLPPVILDAPASFHRQAAP